MAKAFQPDPEGDPSEAPTLTAAATRAGIILGTAAYMSPEQAKGKAVDKAGRRVGLAQIVVESLETAERRVLIDDERDGRYVSTGHLRLTLPALDPRPKLGAPWHHDRRTKHEVTS